MFAIDPAQTGIQGVFVSALVLIIRFAEKRVDRTRNGPLLPRVRYLQERFEELDVKVSDIDREDIIPRLQAVERFVRQYQRLHGEV